MKGSTRRLVVSLSVFIFLPLVYVLIYAGSNNAAPTSAWARNDINICGFQTPLTPGVIRVWNTVFYPLRYLEAVQMPSESIQGELIQPPYPSLCIFIKRDSDAKIYSLLASQSLPLESFRFGQKVIAETGTALDNSLDPACLSRGSNGVWYVKSLRLAQ